MNRKRCLNNWVPRPALPSVPLYLRHPRPLAFARVFLRTHSRARCVRFRALPLVMVFSVSVLSAFCVLGRVGVPFRFALSPLLLLLRIVSLSMS